MTQRQHALKTVHNALDSVIGVNKEAAARAAKRACAWKQAGRMNVQANGPATQTFRIEQITMLLRAFTVYRVAMGQVMSCEHTPKRFARISPRMILAVDDWLAIQVRCQNGLHVARVGVDMMRCRSEEAIPASGSF